MNISWKQIYIRLNICTLALQSGHHLAVSKLNHCDWQPNEHHLQSKIEYLIQLSKQRVVFVFEHNALLLLSIRDPLIKQSLVSVGTFDKRIDIICGTMEI